MVGRSGFEPEICPQAYRVAIGSMNKKSPLFLVEILDERFCPCYALMSFAGHFSLCEKWWAGVDSNH